MFETNNNILVNVLAVEGRDIYIHRKDWKPETNYHEIYLLMISEGPTGHTSRDGIQHYTTIKSLSRLLTSRNTKHKCKQHFCMNCLQSFTLESSKDKHYAYYINNGTVRVEMPKKGFVVEFYNGQTQFKVPFIMYADFEAILEPMQGLTPNSEGSYTKDISQHVPYGWCIYSKFAYGKVEKPLRLYREKDYVEKFCDYIKEEAKRLYHMFPEKPTDPLTKEQWTSYRRASKCHFVTNPFNFKDPKVRDHCHYTGKYRVPAHLLCNLRYRIPSHIPVMLHT